MLGYLGYRRGFLFNRQKQLFCSLEKDGKYSHKNRHFFHCYQATVTFAINIRYNADMNHLTPKQIDQLLLLTQQVAEGIMHFYTSDDFMINQKADDSPVTQADIAASRLLEQELPTIADYPVLSEENVPNEPLWQDWETYWLVDPIDGTKHFINKTGEFCVCIALVHRHQPVLGLICAPTKETIWLAQSTDKSPTKFIKGEKTQLTAKPASPITAALSADHLSSNMHQLLSPLADYQWYRRGSALKYIDIIEGKASIYPKLWDTCEWDSAAGHCLVEAAGGQVINLENTKPLRYGTKDHLINPYFIAFNHLSTQQVQGIFTAYQQLRLKP